MDSRKLARIFDIGLGKGSKLKKNTAEECVPHDFSYLDHLDKTLNSVSKETLFAPFFFLDYYVYA